ncbi:4'-phosphopantetheinyl transferase superfamily protein [Pseudoalteromonas luteoviolacea]|uniref:4'-phosphopantetheinyl transferase family protein n=1 Tax=Pseudoalteromonas luteoviolacea TaxID=43657 RepID=UPI001EEE847D|nr:4'-phosphopantetheinyl transferase superfamily protein [Pseudoalteromonas luteoviolacea]MCF6441535.1 4'-phosphopantetheinyl transferase superfamily protein [Pseudoalteromonas luteoviolacea]
MHIMPVSPFQPQLPFTYHCLAFSPERYQDADFAHFNQPLPSKLGRAVAKRKAEYLAGRVCATSAIQQLGRPHYVVESAESRAPIWPEGINGSITHSKGIAMAIATDKVDVLGLGIDIEHMMSDKQESELRGQILRDDEAIAFTALGQDHQKPLTLVFSAKESIYKALYNVVQTFFGFDAAKLIGHDAKQLRFALTTSLHPTLPAGTEITVYYQTSDEMVLTECVHLG